MDRKVKSVWRAVCLMGGLCVWGIAVDPAPGRAAVESGSLSKMIFGKTPDGTPVELYVLKNGQITVKVMTYGAIITEIDTPDRNGKEGDVVLGFDNLEGYLGKHPYFGATVGRVANRIAKGKFTLNGQEYTLAVNDGPNTLHGGLKGFDKVIWKAEPIDRPDGPSVKLTYRSPDGEEGYPGNLDVSVQFTVTEQNELKIEYTATTDKATPINLSNHSYFNLAGRTTEPILGHELMLAADHYTPVDETLIPTGEIAPVAGTPLDFTKPTDIGARIKQIKGDPVGLRPQLRAQQRRQVPGAGRPGLRAEDRPGHGDVHHRAGRPVLHRQFPGRHDHGQGRHRLPQAPRLLPGGPALSRLDPSPELPVGGPRAGEDLYPDDDLQVLGQVGRAG